MPGRLREKILAFLKQGITPRKLAQTVAVGLFLGTVPLLGATSILCAIASVRLKLNMAVIQAVNYLVYPLQLLLFIPFIKAGTAVLGSGKFNLTLDDVRIMVTARPMAAIVTLFGANMLGVLVWLVVMPGICWLTFRMCRPLFERLDRGDAGHLRGDKIA